MKILPFYILFFLSGVAGLGYEILWTRMLSVSLDHEIVSVLAVVSAFFSGLALGAWFLDRPVSCSTAPGRWYVAFEALIGIWALTLIFLLPALNPFISKLIGLTPSPLRHWGISFLYPFILLLPATVAMGGTLTAIDRLLEKFGNKGKTVAGLYSVNTFGAVIGTLVITFMLIPSFGMNNSAFFLISVNFICASGIFLLSRGKSPSANPYKPAVKLNVSIHQLYLILLITGFLGIGYEILIVRVLSQVLENTIFWYRSKVFA